MSYRRPFSHGLFGQQAQLPGELNSCPLYETTTDDIRVIVQVFWLDEQSEPDDNIYCWAYHIRIENHRNTIIQILERHWEIIDGSGRTEHIRGEGIVGEQPVLAPSSGFEYTSGASLDTPGGIMRGSYTVTERPGGRLLKIRVPPFSLDSPYQPSVFH